MLRKSLILISSTLTFVLLTAASHAQLSNNPFPAPIEAEEGIITINAIEFARLPEIDGVPARMMQLVDEPGTERLFVNDMTGPIYSVSYDGRTVIEYINIDDWGVNVWANDFREGGMQSFAFHPQFANSGTPGYGKFYTWTDSSNRRLMPDFMPSGALTINVLLLPGLETPNPLLIDVDHGFMKSIKAFA